MPAATASPALSSRSTMGRKRSKGPFSVANLWPLPLPRARIPLPGGPSQEPGLGVIVGRRSIRSPAGGLSYRARRRRRHSCSFLASIGWGRFGGRSRCSHPRPGGALGRPPGPGNCPANWALPPVGRPLPRVARYDEARRALTDRIGGEGRAVGGAISGSYDLMVRFPVGAPEVLSLASRRRN